MDISLLADFKHQASKVAKWYFDEWSSADPNASIEGITKKLLLGTNRTKVPILYLGHIDGKLVGAGEIKFRRLNAYPSYHYWLDGIYVDPDFRGKGLSTQLIEFGKEKAIELKIPSLHLKCTEANVKLYEARGYKILSPKDDKYIMGLELNL